MTSREKTLEEALDEMDQWGEQVSKAIEELTPQQVVEYFDQAQERFEKQTGLKFPVRPAPHPRKLINKERTLDEAPDEIDKWSEKMVKEIEGLTPEQVVEYLKIAAAVQVGPWA